MGLQLQVWLTIRILFVTLLRHFCPRLLCETPRLAPDWPLSGGMLSRMSPELQQRLWVSALAGSELVCIPHLALQQLCTRARAPMAPPDARDPDISFIFAVCDAVWPLSIHEQRTRRGQSRGQRRPGQKNAARGGSRLHSRSRSSLNQSGHPLFGERLGTGCPNSKRPP